MMCSYQLIVAILFIFTQQSSTEHELHPFLYFSFTDVTALKQQAKTTHREIFARITQAAAEIKKRPRHNIPPKDWSQFSSKWNEGYGNNLAALAMYCVVEDRDAEARGLAFQIIDAFISLPNWRVKSMWRDNVPVAHSLIGMTTAFDFLYDYLDPKRRVQMLAKMTAVSREIYDHEMLRTEKYIHNHVPTIFVALLTSALVAGKHNSVEATKWKEKANTVLSRTMFLLSQVKDGSMNEGVGYGTYTSRSLTQYVFLAKRHLGIDLTNNPWLQQHFWFMYRTILPGFRETVGIADSNFNWLYGPESQLVFLDKFVMRNGHGNWLANKIRKLRSRGDDPLMASSDTQRYCTLHTEFLFYDASIPDKEPSNARSPQMHIFSDWGVATYGGGALDVHGKRSTFLSFKSSVLHGKAVNQIVRNKNFSWIEGWRNFNPGHEHPDQGSFVFTPYGVPFITEAYYGPKYTWLNNVLLFGPATNPSCSSPYEGQLGDCEKWLRFQDEAIWFADAEIIAAYESGGKVFISGEVSKWYSSSLGLTSVYRAVILLHPGVLVVLDHVAKTSKSRSQYVGAFFHNKDSPFSLKEARKGQQFSEIVLNGGRHQVLWSNSKNYRSIVHCRSAEYPAEYKTRKTHYLNITTNLNDRQTRLAYVFIAPGIEVSQPELNDQNEGIKVSLKINNVLHLISMATNYKTASERYNFLGFDGYAKVQVGGSREIFFGSHEEALPIRTKHIIDLSFTDNILILFVWVSGWLALWFLCARRTRHWKVSSGCTRLIRLRFGTVGLFLLWTALILSTSFLSKTM